MIVFPSRKAPAVFLGGGGGGYSAEAQQFFDRISDPGTTRKNLYAALIDGLVSDGAWALLDALYLFAADNQTTALTNLKQSSYGATAVNSPTFVTDRYFQGDGSTSYLNTNFNPTTASSPNYTQNSATMFGWVLNNAAADRTIIGNTAGWNSWLYPRSEGSSYSFAINGYSTGYTFGSASTSAGLSCADRSGANECKFYRNGTALTTTTPSASLVDETIKILRGAGGCNGAHQIAAAGLGASLDATKQAALYSRLQTYLQGVGAI
jgi:hypothetical protein